MYGDSTMEPLECDTQNRGKRTRNRVSHDSATRYVSKHFPSSLINQHVPSNHRIQKQKRHKWKKKGGSKAAGRGVGIKFSPGKWRGKIQNEDSKEMLNSVGKGGCRTAELQSHDAGLQSWHPESPDCLTDSLTLTEWRHGHGAPPLKKENTFEYS